LDRQKCKGAGKRPNRNAATACAAPAQSIDRWGNEGMTEIKICTTDQTLLDDLNAAGHKLVARRICEN
jgi:hypothetical protein